MAKSMKEDVKAAAVLSFQPVKQLLWKPTMYGVVEQLPPWIHPYCYPEACFLTTTFPFGKVPTNS
jgi:hypothetical protein